MTMRRNMVLEPLCNLLMDVAAWAPGLQEILRSDFARVESLARTRGTERILMIEFPSLGKHLDKSLSSQYFEVGTLPAVFSKSYPFSCLLNRIFYDPWDKGALQAGYIRSNPDENAVFFLRQILNLYKKVKIPCSSRSISMAVREFVEIDASLREPTYCWNSTGTDPNEHQVLLFGSRFSDIFTQEDDTDGLRDLTVSKKAIGLLDAISGIIFQNVALLDPTAIVPRHGPGAVADIKSGGDKYAFPSWGEKLSFCFPPEIFRYSSEEISYLYPSENDTCHVSSAKLLAVPKTIDKPRLITEEPTANQFLQQGLLRWIRQNLPYPLRCCIDFRSQVPSQELVLESSRTGSHASVDLSSASDRLSCWTVERMLRNFGGILPYLVCTRSSTIVDGTGTVDFGVLRLRKFAGQGSAVTFPVQSICYAIVAIASYLHAYGLKPSYRNICKAAGKVRVFGDDIIVPVSCVPYLDVYFKLLQLKINVAKSHYDGAFRESCGMDGFEGHDVTPLYLSHTSPGTAPEEITSWVDVSNNAHIKGLWHLSRWMDSQTLVIAGKLPISRSPLGCLTLHTFCPGIQLQGKRRYNKRLHREEVFGLVPCARHRREQREDHGNLLQFFLEYKPSHSNFAMLENVGITYSVGYTMRSFFRLRKKWVSIY